jgi:hypothetical protein
LEANKKWLRNIGILIETTRFFIIVLTIRVTSCLNSNFARFAGYLDHPEPLIAMFVITVSLNMITIACGWVLVLEKETTTTFLHSYLYCG